MAQEKHPEYIEPTWPSSSPDDHPVTEVAAQRQGADAPFGNDFELPLPLERHGRHWVVREPGTERHDTDFGGDESV